MEFGKIPAWFGFKCASIPEISNSKILNRDPQVTPSHFQGCDTSWSLVEQIFLILTQRMSGLTQEMSAREKMNENFSLLR